MPQSDRIEYSHLLSEKSSQEEDTDYSNYDNSTSTITIDPGTVRPQRAKSVRQYLAKVALVLAAVVILLVMCSVMLWVGRHWPLNLDRQCLNLQSTYSPALKDIDSAYKPTKFNGTLDSPSIYRQAPSPEVDSAWDELEKVGIMRISEEDLLRSGSLTDAVRIPDDYGGGFMASVEVNHQLHCLNFLRKSTFLDYPYYMDKAVEYKDTPSIVRIHLGHCVEMLRQLLMCNADVGIISYHWVENYRTPYPNFNTWHECRNFDQVLKWTQDHRLRTKPGHVWQPQPGEKIFTDPP